MKVILKDADRQWNGTAKAAVSCSMALAKEEHIGEYTQGFEEPYILIKGSNSQIGARLQSLSPGSGIVYADRYLRSDLGLSEDAEVEVEFLSPQEAEEVQIKVSADNPDKGDFLELCGIYLKRQPLSKGQRKVITLYSGEEVWVTIDSVSPADAVLTVNTKLFLIPTKQSARQCFFTDILGLDNEIRMIRERVEMPMKFSDRLQNLGIYPPRGVLLYGPPGCGKTMIARALSSEVGGNFFEINGPEIYNQFYGESEKKLREIFAQAREKSPSVVLIDEIDAIAPSRMNVRGELERRIVTTLLTEMDGLKDLKNVIVVATTNIPDALDPALRRPGRFDYEIRIGVPDTAGRLQMLQRYTDKMNMDDRDEILQEFAKRTHGFSGADTMLLCREAAYCALRRFCPDAITDDLSKLSSFKVCREDFEEAQKRIKPTGMREFHVEVPDNLTWDNAGGLGQVKKTIIDEVIYSIKNPESFKKMGIKPVRGILLYGPPGTGKTLLAKIIACQSGANFISIRGPEVFSKWFGESEQRIRQIFSKAREVSPTIIFFDEIDAITAKRGNSASDAADRVVNQLLTEMDGLDSSDNIYVIAATNRKELLDPAFLRPGRFDYHILVPLPDNNARAEIFGIHLKGKPLMAGIDIGALVQNTEGFSGAHIAEVCRRAGMFALCEAGFDGDWAKISMQDLLDAVDVVGISITNLEKRKIGFNSIEN